jgi:hypothetical protein
VLTASFSTANKSSRSGCDKYLFRIFERIAAQSNKIPESEGAVCKSIHRHLLPSGCGDVRLYYP